MTKPLAAPRGGALFGHFPALQRDPLGFLIRCARDYGPVVPLRLPPASALLLLDSDDIERVLVTDHRNFVKPVWLRTAAVRRILGAGLVTADGDAWRRQRRQCQAAFHPNLLPGYGRTFTQLAARMLERWRPGELRDIQSEMARLTLEIVAQTMLGRDIGEEAGEIGAAMDTIMACFGSKYRVFGLMPLPPSRREARAIGRLDRLVDLLLADDRDDAAQGAESPLLTSLREDPAYNPAQVREQIKTFLAAGHESSALALTWAFLLLAQNPEADARLAQELTTVLGDRMPDPNDLTDLPYTLAVVKEALRLYPPLWMVGRTVVSDCDIGGFRARRGSLVLTSPWAVQRRAAYFPDPDRFLPERWLDPRRTALPRYAYFPFGGGPRVCIGQNFAVMESVLLLAAVARRFRLENSCDDPLRPWAAMTLRPQSGILMRLVERGGSSRT